MSAPSAAMAGVTAVCSSRGRARAATGDRGAHPGRHRPVVAVAGVPVGAEGDHGVGSAVVDQRGEGGDRSGRVQPGAGAVGQAQHDDVVDPEAARASRSSSSRRQATSACRSGGPPRSPRVATTQVTRAPAAAAAAISPPAR